MYKEQLPEALICGDCGCEITLDQYRRKQPRCDDCEVAAALNEFDPPVEPPLPVRVLQGAARPWRAPRRSWGVQLHLRRLNLRLECRIALDDAA